MLKSTLTFSAVLSLATLSHATVLFSDSFEAPTHTAGNPIANGWSATGIISTDTARTGTQSAKGVVNGQVQRLVQGGRFIAPPDAPITNASSWSRATQGATQLFGIQFGQTNFRVARLVLFSSLNLWQVEVVDAGFNTLFSTSGNLTNAGYVAGQWNQIMVSHNDTADTVSFSLNGSVRHTINSFSSFTSANPFAVVMQGNTLGSPSTSEVYFDDIFVESVPEPATLAALGLGAAAMLRRSRRR